jgi:hypothetical protein
VIVERFFFRSCIGAFVAREVFFILVHVPYVTD